MEFNFIEYMRNLASSHKLLRHTEGNKRFYMITSINNLEELLSNTKTNFPVMCVNNDDSGRFNDNNADMVFDRKPYSFYVFANSKNVMDMKEMIVQRELCLVIGFDFFIKMKADKKSDMKGIFPKTGLRNLDISSFTYFQVGPLLDNIIGYEFFFSMDNKPDLKFDANAWDEISPIVPKLKIGWFQNPDQLSAENDLLDATTVLSYNCETQFKINCQAQKYIYFFAPAIFIPDTGLEFWVNGFSGGFYRMDNSVMFNHGDAGVIEYAVYRSDNHSLGYCIVNVKET